MSAEKIETVRTQKRIDYRATLMLIPVGETRRVKLYGKAYLYGAAFALSLPSAREKELEEENSRYDKELDIVHRCLADMYENQRTSSRRICG